jgi:hypothetical protein
MTERCSARGAFGSQLPNTGDVIRQYIEPVDAMPGLSEKAAQVVTLVTAAHFNAAYEIYAHAAIAAQAGLSGDQVATLCSGGIPANLDADSSITLNAFDVPAAES